MAETIVPDSSESWWLPRRFGAWRYGLLAALFSCLACGLAFKIATITQFDVHPDEIQHVDAFCYFQFHGSIPALNLDGLYYTEYGDSRVTSGELVYQVYGRAAAALSWLGNALSLPRSALPAGDSAAPTLQAQLASCQPGYRLYRLFNVALLSATLAFLFVAGLRHAWAAAIGVGMLCLPQVIYVYSYANSDAWALSCSLLLLVYALAQRRPLSSLPKALLLGLLTGLVLLSKLTVWIAIPLAAAVIGYRMWRDWRAADKPKARPYLLNAAAALAACLLVSAPILIVYPLSQGGDLSARRNEVREARAIAGYKPSDPYAPLYRLRAKGASFGRILFDRHWWAKSAKSFYGLFGYLDVPSPGWVYVTALAAGAVNGLLSLVVVWRNRESLPDELRLVLGLAPLVVAGVVGASMFNSWTGDYQPQGRYLFVAIVPLALWLWGLLPWEGVWLRAFRLASAVGLMLLALGVLWVKVL